MGNETVDVWEELRHQTLDQFVTATKLCGAAMLVTGYTTPEGYPFVVAALVATPGNEDVLEFAGELMRKLNERASFSARADNPKAKR